MSSVEFWLFSITMICLMISMILFVVFGQVTVKKLRKNPSTKESLGAAFVSGWDILNVAQAMALPNVIGQVLSKSPLSNLYANIELLSKNTNYFDKLLAVVFYYCMIFSVVMCLLLVFLNLLGFLE